MKSDTWAWPACMARVIGDEAQARTRQADCVAHFAQDRGAGVAHGGLETSGVEPSQLQGRGVTRRAALQIVVQAQDVEAVVFEGVDLYVQPLDGRAVGLAPEAWHREHSISLEFGTLATVSASSAPVVERAWNLSSG
ncbi:MAG: hypothetical protein R3E96_05580 [Planctomycetota bacterium]